MQVLMEHIDETQNRPRYRYTSVHDRILYYSILIQLGDYAQIKNVEL